MAYHYLWLEVQHAGPSDRELVARARWRSGWWHRSFPELRSGVSATALIATVVIAVVNVTIGPILRFLTFPLTFLTLGLFLLVVNALLLKLASMFTPGFRVAASCRPWLARWC